MTGVSRTTTRKKTPAPAEAMLTAMRERNVRVAMIMRAARGAVTPDGYAHRAISQAIDLLEGPL